MSASNLEFQKIHETYRPRILRYLTRLVGERESEDLTQEVFFRVSRALPTFRAESQLSTWIYRIASNAAIDKLRSPVFRQDAQTDSLMNTDGPEHTDTCPGMTVVTPEQRAMQKERSACYRSFIDDLPSKYRAVVVLNELGDLSNQEIAQILGLAVNVVKIRLHRGREKLLQELQIKCKVEDWL